MRAYFFGNYYLSSLQQGLQALHVLGDIIVEYGNHNPKLQDWLHNHKTVILCKGGNADDLIALHTKIAQSAIKENYPFGIFAEDKQSLNYCVTSVGIILDEYVYQYMEWLRKNRDPYLIFTEKIITKEQVELAELLYNYPLAN